MLEEKLKNKQMEIKEMKNNMEQLTIENKFLREQIIIKDENYSRLKQRMESM